MTIILEISFILFFPKKRLSRERSTTKAENKTKKNFMLFIRSNDNYRKQTYLKERMRIKMEFKFEFKMHS